MPQNYKLNCQLGKHPHGAVVPAHVVEVGHDAARLLELGLVEPTDLPTTVALAVPAPLTAAPPDTVEAERDRLAEENERLRDRCRTLDGVVKELERARDGFERKCHEYAAGVVHLETACADHQKTIDAARAEAATAVADREAAASRAAAAEALVADREGELKKVAEELAALKKRAK